METKTKSFNLGPYSGQYLVFHCGCITPTIMVSMPYSGRGRKCPVCGSKMVNKLLLCPDCKKTFIIGVGARKKFRCSKCAKKFASLRRYKKEDYSKIDNISGIDRSNESKIYCMHYSECLNEAAKQNKKYLSCEGCKRYAPREMHSNVNAKSSIPVKQPFANSCRTNWRT